VRPLLDMSRAELEAYAREQQLNWIEDPLQRRLTFLPQLPASSSIPTAHRPLAPGREYPGANRWASGAGPRAAR
jgi:hypothetical protein